MSNGSLHGGMNGRRTGGLKALVLETRPHFLLLTPACVLVGAAAVYWDHGRLEPLYLFLAFLGALLGHISVNVLNDVGDFLTEIDLHTDPTPFSGGSGFLVRGEITPVEARFLGLGALAGTLPIGAFFLWKQGWGLLPIGLIGIILVVTYTPWITHYPWICLLAPGLGFGPVMVLGVTFCLTGAFGKTALTASLVPGFLVSNLLLLNQFPDVNADAQGGRLHLPIKWGLEKASRLYTLFLIAPYGWLVLAVALGLLPAGALVACLTLPLALMTARGVRQYCHDRIQLIPLLGKNVAITLVTPVLLALGMFLQRFC